MGGKLEIFILTLLPLLALVSCSKEKEEKEKKEKEEEENTSIIGKWELTSQHADVVTSDEILTGIIRANYDKNSGMVLTFKEDGRVTVERLSDAAYENLYSIEGDKLTFTAPATNESYTYKYSISNNILTLNDDRTEVFQDTFKEYDVVIRRVIVIQKYARK